MGYVDHPSALASHQLTASDYVRLAILGCAVRCPIFPDDIVRSVESLAGPLWAPSGHLVLDAIEVMVGMGYLANGEGGLGLLITGPGRRALTGLLTQPVSSPLSAFGQVGIRLKMAFLDILPPILRRHQIAGLIHAYECDLATQTAGGESWPLNGVIGRNWLDHQMDMLEDGIALLRRLARAEEPLLY
jgi:hypothetical protein